MRVDLIRILPQAAADQIDLEPDEPKRAASPDGSAGAYSAGLDPTRETLLGDENVSSVGSEILIIQGKASSFPDLTAFIDRLSKKRLLTRFQLIRSDNRRTQDIRYVLKGVLP